MRMLIAVIGLCVGSAYAANHYWGDHWHGGKLNWVFNRLTISKSETPTIQSKTYKNGEIVDKSTNHHGCVYNGEKKVCLD